MKQLLWLWCANNLVPININNISLPMADINMIKTKSSSPPWTIPRRNWTPPLSVVCQQPGYHQDHLQNTTIWFILSLLPLLTEISNYQFDFVNYVNEINNQHVSILAPLLRQQGTSHVCLVETRCLLIDPTHSHVGGESKTSGWDLTLMARLMFCLCFCRMRIQNFWLRLKSWSLFCSFLIDPTHGRVGGEPKTPGWDLTLMARLMFC